MSELEKHRFIRTDYGVIELRIFTILAFSHLKLNTQNFYDGLKCLLASSFLTRLKDSGVIPR